jgi:hypothetical protein
MKKNKAVYIQQCRQVVHQSKRQKTQGQSGLVEKGGKISGNCRFALISRNVNHHYYLWIVSFETKQIISVD